MIKFNVNHNVWVKLTDTGRSELKKQAAAFRAEFPNIKDKYVLPKEDKDGWSRWQMHSLMNSFGHMMVMGGDLPFETEIKLEI